MPLHATQGSEYQNRAPHRERYPEIEFSKASLEGLHRGISWRTRADRQNNDLPAIQTGQSCNLILQRQGLWREYCQLDLTVLYWLPGTGS